MFLTGLYLKLRYLNFKYEHALLMSDLSETIPSNLFKLVVADLNLKLSIRKNKL